jgi:hypothetical protein
LYSGQKKLKKLFHFTFGSVRILEVPHLPFESSQSSLNSKVKQLRLNMRGKETHSRAPSEYQPSRRAVIIVAVVLVIAIGAFGYYCYQFVERQAVVRQSQPAAPITTPEPEASPSVVASGKRTTAPPTISATPEQQEEFPSEPLSLPAQPTTAQYRCDGRTRCSQMTSCDEAKFFLRTCPGTQLDGDSDGIPCEQQWCEN